MAGVRITCEALWPERLAEQQKGKGRRVDGVERVNDGGILRTDARLAECLEPLCDGRGDDGQVAELRPVLGERRGGFGRLSEGEDSPSHEYIYMYMYINIASSMGHRMWVVCGQAPRDGAVCRATEALGRPGATGGGGWA